MRGDQSFRVTEQISSDTTDGREFSLRQARPEARKEREREREKVKCVWDEKEGNCK